MIPTKVRLAATAIVAAALVWLSTGSAHAAGAVTMKAVIDQRNVTSIDQNQPLRLHPDQQVVVDLTVTNNTTRDLSVRSVNLNGRVMGLTFFSFETRIDLIVAPGATETRTFAIELVGLKGQATGLLPGQLDLLDEHRNVVTSRSFATDVQGSLGSVYGVFGVMVAAITVLLAIGAAIRLATHRLSIHRWSRGAHLAAPGLGLGLTLTFSLSALRVLLPAASSWLTIVVVCTIVLFVIGYITPTPVIYFDDEETETSEGPIALTPAGR